MPKNYKDFEKSTKIKTAIKLKKDTDSYKMLGRLYQGMPGTKIYASYANPPAHAKYNKLIHLGSYNYSGLNDDKRVLAAAKQAIDEYGVTTSGVRLLNGTSDLHVQFENKLAAFLGVEDAVSYSSGFSANVSVLSCLCSHDDYVFSDALNHQSLVDGMLLSGAKIIKYKHNDMADLARLLQNTLVAKNAKCFIVTDSIFSMDGDIALLDKIVALAEQYNCYTIVDEAHAIAAYGPNGKGVVYAFGLMDKVDVITGSLSKGLPGVGGFAAGNKMIMDILRYGSHSYIFSASLPPAIIAGLMESIDILESDPSIQAKLKFNITYFSKRLTALGFNILNSTTAIIPILMPTNHITFSFASLLQEKGYYVNPVIYPAVPLYEPRIRINISAALTQDDLDSALMAFKEVGEKLEVVPHVSNRCINL